MNSVLVPTVKSYHYLTKKTVIRLDLKSNMTTSFGAVFTDINVLDMTQIFIKTTRVRFWNSTYLQPTLSLPFNSCLFLCGLLLCSDGKLSNHNNLLDLMRWAGWLVKYLEARNAFGCVLSNSLRKLLYFPQNVSSWLTDISKPITRWRITSH